MRRGNCTGNMSVIGKIKLNIADNAIELFSAPGQHKIGAKLQGNLFLRFAVHEVSRHVKRQASSRDFAGHKLFSLLKGFGDKAFVCFTIKFFAHNFFGRQSNQFKSFVVKFATSLVDVFADLSMCVGYYFFSS